MPTRDDPWILVLISPAGEVSRLLADGQFIRPPWKVEGGVPLAVMAEILTQAAASKRGDPGTPWGRVGGWQWRAERVSVGDPYVRDPEHPCASFDPSPAQFSDARECQTDGHYLCAGCRWRIEEGEDHV